MRARGVISTALNQRKSPGGNGFATGLLIAGAVIALAFLTVFFAWPVANMIARGFMPDGAVDLGGFADVFSSPRTWRIVGYTILNGVLGTSIAVVLALPGAYVLYRCSFPGQRLLRGIVTVPFVLPTVVVGVAFRSLLIETGPLGFLGLDGTYTAIVLALVFFNYSVIVRSVGGMWARLDPRATEAAAALGAPPARRFLTVTLPQLTPAIASSASVVFLFCATAYGVVLVLGGTTYGTIETEIWMQTTQFLNLRAASVLSVVQLVVVAAALWVAGRARRSRERALVMRARVDRPLDLRRDAFSVAITAVVVLGLLAAPMLSLLLRSFQTPHGWGIQNYVNLGTTGGRNALTVTVWEALGNSLRVAAWATLIAVVLGAIVAIILSTRPRNPIAARSVGLLDAVFMLPLGVSAVTVGFGFLITLNRPPFDLRSSMILIPIAQAIVALPLVVRTVLPVLRAIDPRQREAAAVLGAGPIKTFATVDAPPLVRSLGLALGFAFAISLGEFGATSFLARPDAPTLPVVIFRLIGRPGAENFGMALAACVILAAMTATVMIAAERLRTNSEGEW